MCDATSLSQTPYKLVFGQRAKCGISSLRLSDDLLNGLWAEDDLLAKLGLSAEGFLDGAFDGGINDEGEDGGGDDERKDSGGDEGDGGVIDETERGSDDEQEDGGGDKGKDGGVDEIEGGSDDEEDDGGIDERKGGNGDEGEGGGDDEGEGGGGEDGRPSRKRKFLPSQACLQLSSLSAGGPFGATMPMGGPAGVGFPAGEPPEQAFSDRGPVGALLTAEGPPEVALPKVGHASATPSSPAESPRRKTSRAVAASAQKQQAGTMRRIAARRGGATAAIGQVVQIPVEKVDRAKLDDPMLLAMVVEVPAPCLSP
jgi:hypothetical protein